MSTSRWLDRPCRAMMLVLLVVVWLLPGLAAAESGETALAESSESASKESATSPHVVRTTKFTINADVEANSTFYQEMFEMIEFNRYEVENLLIEPFVGYNRDARVGLLSFKEQETIEKSPYPVTVIYTPAFETVTARLKAAGHSVRVLSEPEANGQTGGQNKGMRVAITQDPSGNSLEIVERPGSPAVAGAKLIVGDRQKAEEFFVRLFDVEASRSHEANGVDQVFLSFGGEMFVALFEPTGAPPFPRSEHPVVAIYSTEFDEVLSRVKEDGTEHREYGTSMFLAKDPSGNVVEVVRQKVE